MKYKNIILGILIILLAGCNSQEKRVEYFRHHPEELQQLAQECAMKLKRNENIGNDSNCQDVIATEKQDCEYMHKQGALFYMDYDCNNSTHMIILGAEGR